MDIHNPGLLQGGILLLIMYSKKLIYNNTILVILYVVAYKNISKSFLKITKK